MMILNGHTSTRLPVLDLLCMTIFFLRNFNEITKDPQALKTCEVSKQQHQKKLWQHNE
jgi:hypothetical protein